jgi:hypothetical protein
MSRKIPNFEPVIPNAFVDLPEGRQCYTQKDPASGKLSLPCAG